jgi:hypothetical protein
MTITISESRYTKIDQASGSEAGIVSHFFVRDREKQIVLGTFTAESQADRDAAFAEALACREKYEAAAWQSPFVTHREKLMGCYGGAKNLRDIALSLYNGRSFPCDLSSVCGLDGDHFTAAMEMIRSYHHHGESDRDFIDICREIVERKKNREGKGH